MVGGQNIYQKREDRRSHGLLSKTLVISAHE
jgi:hypothetical protein